jgi:uncharacterized protein
MKGKAPLRYNSFQRYLRRRYGGRIQKIPLDAGFGCPHRPGEDRRQGEGCIYCENTAFSPRSVSTPPPLRDQIERGILQGTRRYRPLGFIAYFQAYTNTLGSPEMLRERYDVIREFPEIKGLAVGTRPDCVDEAVLDLLQSYCSEYEVWVEYGLQSASDATLRRIRRGHGVDAFLRAVERTAVRRLLVCVHVILGLPGEGPREMMETARLLAGLPVQGVKIHHCHVIRGTPLAEEFESGRYRPLDYEQYLSLVCDFLEILPWPVTIHRLIGEAPAHLLLSPKWDRAKSDFLRDVQQELTRRGTAQGVRSTS